MLFLLPFLLICDKESWRKVFQMEDEDAALARALELSRLDHQQSQRASANPPDEKSRPSSSNRRPRISLVNRSTHTFRTECNLKIVPRLVLAIDNFWITFVFK